MTQRAIGTWEMALRTQENANQDELNSWVLGGELRRRVGQCDRRVQEECGVRTAPGAAIMRARKVCAIPRQTTADC
jgi:hypothetical protein